MTRSQDSSDVVDGRPDSRPLEVLNDAPPDPRAVIDDLRRRLRVEQEKALNAVDAVLAARAAAAQARAETQEVFYRLHVRETELNQLKELLVELEGRLDDENGPETETPTPSEAARTLLSSVRRAVAER